MDKRECTAYRIRSAYASLRKSEQRVADYILTHEQVCRRITMEELAKRSNVSQPTVVRFVKALGYENFKDFRYQLMEENIKDHSSGRVEQYAMHGYSLKLSDNLRMIPTKVVAISVKSIEDMLKSISGEEFEKDDLYDIQSKKNHVKLCGKFISNGKDLMVKLLYLGYDCRYDEDYYIQQIAAAALTEEDVVIGISYSGQSKDTVDVMKTAKKAGAQTICITNFKESKISKWSDVVLCGSQEQWMYGDSIFSRTTQMVLNDMIYMGLIAHDYEKCTDKLDENGKIIRNKAYEEK